MALTKGVLVSAGRFSQFHIEAWKRIDSIEITAVADSTPGKAQSFATNCGIERSYESVEQMLDHEQPEFVDVVTRPDSHLDLTKLAAVRGIHVICQKPMAPTWDDCRSMVEICEATGVRLLIHENWRWQPWYREAHRIMHGSALGRVFSISAQWRTGDGRGSEPYTAQPYFRAMPRLLVYETLVHLLDTFRYLGGEMASVFCQNRRVNPAIAGEDMSLILIAFQNGVAGLIDANRISGPKLAEIAMNSLRIEGESGMLRLTPDGRLWWTEYGQAEREHRFANAETTTGYKGDSVRATQQHLIECLRSGNRSESEGRDYLKTVEAMFACYLSADTRQVVAL